MKNVFTVLKSLKYLGVNKIRKATNLCFGKTRGILLKDGGRWVSMGLWGRGGEKIQTTVIEQ